MNVTVRQLRAFVLVIEKGGFTQAAREMHVTQAALSLLVRELERGLATRLLDRTTRSVSPTAVGQEFHTHARRILDDLAHAVGNVDKLVAKQRGRVVVAAPLVLAGTFLPPVLASFRADFPGIELVLKDSLPDQVLPQVRAGSADLGIGTFHQTEADLTRVLLFKESLVAAFAPDHPFARAKRLRWQDLKGQPVLTLPRGSVFRDLAEAGFAAAGLSLVPSFEATYVGTLLGLVKAGFGTAIVPGYAMALADANSMAWKRLQQPLVEREVLLIHRGGHGLSPAAQAFAAHLGKRSV